MAQCGPDSGEILSPSVRLRRTMQHSGRLAAKKMMSDAGGVEFFMRANRRGLRLAPFRSGFTFVSVA
jgi:hypothetical protein